NRSRDRRWVRNLAIWDDRREVWRYVGAMTRSSEKPNWFTERGLVQNMDDAFVGLVAGLFLLSKERQKKGLAPFSKIGMGFGVPVKAGENAAEEFFKYLRTRLQKDGDASYVTIKAKNVATGEVEEMKIRLSFIAVQFQGYGAYMALLFGKYNQKLFNTYVIDVGHGTWIKLPVIENEVDMLLADSAPQGMHTITENISRVIFEKSRQRFRIPEQRIMEKLPRGDYRIEVPAEGVFDFKPILESEADALSESILTRIRGDLQALSRRGQFVDYFAVVGGGAPLVFERLRAGLRRFYDWTEETAAARVIDMATIGSSPRTINAVGFMLLARDQIAVELGEPVDPKFEVKSVTTDEIDTAVEAPAAATTAPKPVPTAAAALSAAPANGKHAASGKKAVTA
ncbi:MAG TPA: hypothetical protein VHF22_12435, partial [Planctomycetota bacterium]|nr:hypothetical protein [Planctomycetota bacterium]